jgi:hypothetical protein
MKNISTGFGLCVAAAASLAYPFVSSLAPSANASAVTAAASAVGHSATGQVGATIVWYQALARPYTGGDSTGGYGAQFWVVRAWSDGKIEARLVAVNGSNLNGCSPTTTPSPCTSPWMVISDPAQGQTYRSDINFDAQVDGADLGQLLADWGNAPRQDIPPSDCPLALINP